MAKSRRLKKSKEFDKVEAEIKSKSKDALLILTQTKLKKTELNQLMTTSVKFGNFFVFKYFIEELNLNPLIRSGDLLYISINSQLNDFFDYFMDLKEIENDFVLHSMCYTLLENNQLHYIKKAFKHRIFRRALAGYHNPLYQELIAKKKIKENLVSF